MKKIVAFVLALVLVFSLAGAAMADEAKGADVKGTGVALTIYTNSGVLYLTARLNKGTNWLGGLPRGRYFINNRPITIN